MKTVFFDVWISLRRFSCVWEEDLEKYQEIGDRYTSYKIEIEQSYSCASLSIITIYHLTERIRQPSFTAFD